ncbi:hypothetical protein K438DRAFT_699262 [Mycena galopus ATCC 62051]|nr:hypothetical protein K438DRAFT_699262 [Mycena galopus ATCC 62051]
MLPFAQLTSLALEFVFRSEYAVILPQTFNLVHCKLGIVSDGEGDRAPDKGIELRCLESLALFMSADGPVLDSLDDFIVPSLRHLRLAESFLGLEPIDRLSSFIAKSGCKLQEVFVAERTIRRGSYREEFPSIPQFSFDDDSDAVSISTVFDTSNVRFAISFCHFPAADDLIKMHIQCSFCISQAALKLFRRPCKRQLHSSFFVRFSMLCIFHTMHIVLQSSVINVPL